jgi:hypothetical protein
MRLFGFVDGFASLTGLSLQPANLLFLKSAPTLIFSSPTTFLPNLLPSVSCTRVGAGGGRKAIAAASLAPRRTAPLRSALCFRLLVPHRSSVSLPLACAMPVARLFGGGCAELWPAVGGVPASGGRTSAAFPPSCGKLLVSCCLRPPLPSVPSHVFFFCDFAFCLRCYWFLCAVMVTVVVDVQ